MSMILSLHAVSDAGIDILLKDPKLIHAALMGGREIKWEPEALNLLNRLERLLGFWRRQRPVRKRVELPDALRSISRQSLDIDKSWHGMHYLFTEGAADPEDEYGCDDERFWLIFGGVPVGEEDVGYGPARALASHQVKRWNAYIQSIDEDALRLRFNPEDMMKQGIYPSIWDRDPGEDDTFGYVIEYLHGIKTFLADCSAAGQGVIVVLS